MFDDRAGAYCKRQFPELQRKFGNVVESRRNPLERTLAQCSAPRSDEHYKRLSSNMSRLHRFQSTTTSNYTHFGASHLLHPTAMMAYNFYNPADNINGYPNIFGGPRVSPSRCAYTRNPALYSDPYLQALADEEMMARRDLASAVRREQDAEEEEGGRAGSGASSR